MFTRSEVIVLTNKHANPQTNRRRWKHPTLFATLRRLLLISWRITSVSTTQYCSFTHIRLIKSVTCCPTRQAMQEVVTLWAKILRCITSVSTGPTRWPRSARWDPIMAQWAQMNMPSVWHMYSMALPCSLHSRTLKDKNTQTMQKNNNSKIQLYQGVKYRTQAWKRTTSDPSWLMPN